MLLKQQYNPLNVQYVYPSQPRSFIPGKYFTYLLITLDSQTYQQQLQYLTKIVYSQVHYT